VKEGGRDEEIQTCIYTHHIHKYVLLKSPSFLFGISSVNVRVRRSVCVHMQIKINTYMKLIYIQTFCDTHTNSHTHSHTHSRTHTHTHTHTHTCLYMYIYIYIYINIYIHIKSLHCCSNAFSGVTPWPRRRDRQKDIYIHAYLYTHTYLFAHTNFTSRRSRAFFWRCSLVKKTGLAASSLFFLSSCNLTSIDTGSAITFTCSVEYNVRSG